MYAPLKTVFTCTIHLKRSEIRVKKLNFLSLYIADKQWESSLCYSLFHIKCIKPQSSIFISILSIYSKISAYRIGHMYVYVYIIFSFLFLSYYIFSHYHHICYFLYHGKQKLLLLSLIKRATNSMFHHYCNWFFTSES